MPHHRNRTRRRILVKYLRVYFFGFVRPHTFSLCGVMRGYTRYCTQQTECLLEVCRTLYRERAVPLKSGGGSVRSFLPPSTRAEGGAEKGQQSEKRLPL